MLQCFWIKKRVLAMFKKLIATCALTIAISTSVFAVEIPMDAKLDYNQGIDFYKLVCYNMFRDLGHMPVWWNWQTRRTQNPKVAIPCRFDPDYRHQKQPEINRKEEIRLFFYPSPNGLVLHNAFAWM